MKDGDLLLVVDMQNVYTKEQKWECRNTEGAALNILKIAHAFPSLPVFCTEYIASQNAQGVWKDYNTKYADVNSSPFLNEVIPTLKELYKKNPSYKKSVYSSLAVPQILEECRKAKRVLVTGVVAECCVLSTVLNLIDEGIYALYITDGVSGLDRPKEEATELILSGLSPLHVKMMTTSEYIEEK